MLDLLVLASLCWWYSMANSKVNVYSLSSFLHMPLFFLPQSSQDFLEFLLLKSLVFIPTGPWKEENGMKILTSFGILLGESGKCKGTVCEKLVLLSQVCKLTESPQSLPWIQGICGKPRNLVVLRIITVGYKMGAQLKRLLRFWRIWSCPLLPSWRVSLHKLFKR